jgi:hypothetical protein
MDPAAPMLLLVDITHLSLIRFAMRVLYGETLIMS